MTEQNGRNGLEKDKELEKEKVGEAEYGMQEYQEPENLRMH